MPSDDKPSNESAENIQKKRGWPKGRKRKKLTKDENAPRKPVTGYTHFMNKRRDALSKENSNMSFAEITKLVGEEWNSMSSEQKAVYVDAADKEKEFYVKQLKSYRQNDTYKNLLKKGKVSTSHSYGRPNKVEAKKCSTSALDEPIFTESFLDYNKSKESELHQLSRTNAEYEQHNSILETHLDNLRNAIIKLESESRLHVVKNNTLDSKLLYFRQLLISAFSDIKLPTTKELPSLESVDAYMAEMCNILENNTNNDIEFATSVYDAMSSVSFQTLDGYFDDQKSE